MALYLLAGSGAALGALSRWLLLGAVDSLWTLLFINALGSFALGVLTRRGASPFWTTGFCGGFTSFSAYMAIATADVRYAALTVVVCVACAYVGLRGSCLSTPSR
ncbi:camphor resistance protein CrcB [Corynebacterium ciconiae DSM 44920]|uniref:CrcB family protein n=1 Tax=Corynebacterium ciconiae TaxID=227319 RepID=UPI0009FBB43A|nr:CrcB family protein [Corynebacterium ciconiae]WKD61912.1 camphor resistance protein CrcB [Corynebacterium ciconiae DSM 44920]